MAQPVEVDIGAGVDGDQGAGSGMGCGPGLEARKRHRARGLGDGAAVVEDVLDGGADGVGVHQDDLVQQIPAQAEGLGPGAAHGHPVGEQADLVQGHDLAGVDGGLHRGGVDGFDADDAGLGAQEFEDGRDAGGQAAAADGDEDGLYGVGVLTGDLQPHRALASDDIGIVEGVDEGGAGPTLQMAGVGVGLVETVAVQDHFAAQGAHGGHLDAGGGGRHDDGRGDVAAGGGQGHPLRVIAGRGADHTL